MLRKLLVIAAAVAIPASVLATVTTIGVAGPAGAVKTYKSQTCVVTGNVVFAKPGLSFNGSLSSATVSKAHSTAVATGTGCGLITINPTVGTTKNTITTPSTNCHTAPAPQPGACAHETATKFFAYDTASSLASSGVSSIVASLGPLGIKIVDNNNTVHGAVTSSGTTSVAGGACGAGNLGFQLQGNTNVPTLTYNLLLCITGDTGPGTTGAFGTDYLAAAGGNTGVTIATGIYGGNSLLTLTKS
jgi:hypothetical protein